MELSPLSQVLPTFDAPTLQGLDEKSAVDGQRMRGLNRQFVRFYNKTFTEVYTILADINPKTGTSTPKKTGVREVTKEFVQIITPGDKNEIDNVATDWHRHEFFQQYKAFRDGKTAPLGTPLEEATFINSHLALELKYRGVHTLEQLADAADYLCSQLPSGFELRDFAKATVQAAGNDKQSAKVTALVTELSEIKAVLAKMQAVQSIKPVADLTPNIVPAKRGPKPKVKVIAE